MPIIMVKYVHWVDAFNRRMGRITMYLIFVMIGVLMFSTISKTFFNPSLWTLEVAQFLMVAYFLLGGPYSMQLGDHVRMDLVYGSWSIKTKAWVDIFTVFFLLTYLGVLLYGALGSAAYSLGFYGSNPFEFWGALAWDFITGGPAAAKENIGFLDRAPSAWRPYMWPIKSIMAFGIFMMLLQAISELFKDIAKLRGVTL